MKPIIRSSQQGRTVSLVGDVYRFLATGEDTNSKYTLIEALVSPGGGPPTARPQPGGGRLLHPRRRDRFYDRRQAGRGDAGDVRQHAGRHAPQLQE